MILLLLLFVTWLTLSIITQLPDKKVHLVFCDVGEGDAILLSYGYHQVLIDGGKDEKVLSCLEEKIPFWDHNLDLVVATHMDADHIGGLSAVLSRYSTEAILTNPSFKKTAVFNAFETAVLRETNFNGEKTPSFTSFLGEQFILANVIKMTVVSPQESLVQESVENWSNTETMLSAVLAEKRLKKSFDEEENNLSIGILVNIFNTKILLTGDMEKKSELAMLTRGMTKPIDILKVGHHGSKSSSAKQFLSILRPEVAVISVGKNNPYYHPSPQVLSTLSELGSRVYRTDLEGTIEFVIDKQRYKKVGSLLKGVVLFKNRFLLTH